LSGWIRHLETRGLASLRAHIRRDLGQGKGRFRPIPLSVPNAGIVQEYIYFLIEKKIFLELSKFFLRKFI